MGRRYLHGLQVVAVGLFIGLLLSFYILLLPFLGQITAQASVSTLYSIAAAVLVYLYIVCVIADNGDSGVKKRQEEELRQAYGKMCSPTPLVGGPPTPSFNYEFDPLFPSKEDPKSHELRSPFSEACGYTTLSLEEGPNDVTVCFLCNKKVLRSSKHCRSCDKCVMGFDHHCRWLNNCVGKKNYNYFVALMAVCLCLLFMEGGVGVMVITRCFTQGDMMAQRIHQKLGLSRGCFISLAVLISVASFSASAAVGELLLFHMLLIKKGLSTYEFVLASKELNAEHIDVDDGDFNRKGDSNLASNLLLCRRRGSFFYGGWCTTHRVFLDPEYQQDDTMHIAHQKMSSADFNKEIASPVTIKSKPKPKPVKVNIWHLMRLNAHEARRALERRSSSSSFSSSPYTAKSPSTTGKSSTRTSFNNKNKMDLQPLPVEARCGFRDQFHSILPPSTNQMRSIIEEEEEGILSSSSSMSSYFDSDNYYSEEASEEGSDRGLRQQQQQLSKDSSSTPIDKILINDSSIFFSGPLTVEREGDLFH